MSTPTNEELHEITQRVAETTGAGKCTLAEFLETLDADELEAMRQIVVEARRGYVKATTLS